MIGMLKHNAEFENVGTMERAWYYPKKRKYA